MSAAQDTNVVDPVRLAPGRWCHHAEKVIGEGDISASYSAERIGMGKPVRKPFSWRGALWVCISLRGRSDELSAEAYQLTHPQAFDAEIVTYAQRAANGDAARSDPNGFYHGMSVKHGNTAYVLSGPPVRFTRGETEQLSLF